MAVITGSGDLQARNAGINHQKPFYLAGPMSGIPQFNLPMFKHAADTLRAQGIPILNPAEEDSPETQEAAWNSPDGDLSQLPERYGSILSRCVETVLEDVAGIILLPGWHRSNGARLEVFVGLQINLPLFLYNNGTPKRHDPAEAVHRIVLAIFDRLEPPVESLQ